MKTHSKLLTTALLIFTALSFTQFASAATVYPDSYKHVNKIPLSMPGGVFISSTTGPDRAFTAPGTISQGTGQNVETAYFDTFGISINILNWTKYETVAEYSGLGATSGFFNPGTGTSFTGFLLNAGTRTLVAFFDTAVTNIYWNTIFAGPNPQRLPHDLSHLAFFNTGDTPPVSEVPVPAAIWLFAPALLALFSIRRKYTA